MGVCWQVILSTTVGMLGIFFGWSVSGCCLGSLSLWSFLQPGITLGKTTETQASIKLSMVGSYNKVEKRLEGCTAQHRGPERGCYGDLGEVKWLPGRVWGCS